MKKIVSAAAIAAMVAGAAFAEVSWAANARVYDDIVTYESSTRKDRNADSNKKGTDDEGKVTWNKDTKHADDVTLNAKGDNCGAKIVFNVTSNSMDNAYAATSATVGLTSYKLWANLNDKLTLNFGAYDDTRLGKNINNDGNWGTNLSGSYKPGIMKHANFKLDGLTVGSDSSMVTTLNADKKVTNVAAVYKVNDKITAHAAMFLATNGWNSLTDTKVDSNSTRFSPFAVGAKMAVNKDTAVSATIKNEKNVAASLSAVPAYTYGAYPKFAGLPGYVTVNGGYSIWSANVDFSTKVSGWTVEAGYTLAAQLFDNIDTMYGHHADYWTRSASDHNGHARVEDNVYIHGFDLRATGKVGDKLTVTAIGNLTYKAPTVHLTHVTAEFGENKYNAATGTLTIGRIENKAYKNEEAYNADKGLSGVLAHWESLSVDYALNSKTVIQVQAKQENSNVYAVGTKAEKYVKYWDGSAIATKTASQLTGFAAKKELDPLKNYSLTVRPAIKYAVSKQCQLDLGVQFAFTSFSALERNSANDTFKTTVSVPLCARVKL